MLSLGMSAVSASTLKRRSSIGARTARRITAVLAHAYGSPRHGNKRNPLDELVYIILSNRTLPKACREAYRAIKTRFPSWNALAPEAADELEEILKPSGMSRLRSTHLLHIMAHLRARFGTATLVPLRYMSDTDAENLLISLPGVSRKVAKCVIMYSLHGQVLPVDVHVHRVASRIGFQVKRRPDTSQDLIEEAIPADSRYDFHVNAIAHGRAVCRARSPRCHMCPIMRYCSRVGLASIGD